MRVRLFVIVVFALIYAGIVSADDLKLSASAIPRNLHVGDLVTLTISAEPDSNVRVIFPGDELSLDPFSILNRRMDVDRSSDRDIELLILEISIYEVGTFKIPSIPIIFERADGEMGEIGTDPIDVTVTSVLKDETEPRGIKGPVRVDAKWMYQAAVIGGLILLLITAVLIGWFIARFKRKKALIPIPPPPPRPAHEIAREQLEALRKRNLPGKREIKLFFICLTEILKAYVGQRYAFPALERTSREVAQDLDGMKVDRVIRTEIVSILELSDYVKFARHSPADEAVREIFSRVELIIEKTIEHKLMDTEPANIPEPSKETA